MTGQAFYLVTLDHDVFKLITIEISSSLNQGLLVSVEFYSLPHNFSLLNKTFITETDDDVITQMVRKRLTRPG